MQAAPSTKSFFYRRLHSILGLWLVLFLIEHLLTNSQAAFMFGEDGHGFIHSVNWLQNIPYLHVIELAVLGLPFLIHGLWGMHFAAEAKPNSFSTRGEAPALTEYRENRAYTWQRITSWILVIGIIAHVVQMRFVEAPISVKRSTEQLYLVRLSLDQGLITLAERLGVTLYNNESISFERKEAGPSKTSETKGIFRAFLYSFKELYTKPKPPPITSDSSVLITAQKMKQEKAFVDALERRAIKNNEVIAVAPDFGSAELLLVRDTFKSPYMMLLYTLFVVAATFHAFNGLWTFLITWGFTLTERSQILSHYFTRGLMLLFSFLGLATVWLTYWINLKS